MVKGTVQTTNLIFGESNENCSSRHNQEIAGAIPAPATFRFLTSIREASVGNTTDIEAGPVDAAPPPDRIGRQGGLLGLGGGTPAPPPAYSEAAFHRKYL